MDKDQKAATLKWISHQWLCTTEGFFCTSRELQTSFNLYWQELHRAVGAIPSSFGCSASKSTATAFAWLHGLPSQPLEQKKSWNTISFPRGLLAFGFLCQALSRHKPRTDLVQKKRSKFCCVTASYKENICAARRNLWFCHKEQDLPITLSVHKHSKVSASLWTILCRNWGEKDRYVLTYSLQNMNWAWISSKRRTFPSS